MKIADIRRDYIFVSVLIVLALVIPWIGLGMGAPSNGDEGYMNLCIRDYRNSPLAMLTFYTGHLWTSLFGDDFLTIRRLGYVMGNIAILIGCVYFFQRTRNLLQAMLLFALGCAVMSLERFLIYNWDVAAYPYYALLAVFLIDEIRSPRIWKVCGAGMAVTLLFLSRIQLVVLVPVFAVVLAIVFREVRGRCMKHLVAYLLSVSVTLVLLAWRMWGSVGAYFSAFSSDNIITGHGADDIRKIYYGFRSIFARNISTFSLSLFTITVAIVLCIRNKISEVKKISLYVVLALVGLGYYFVMSTICSTLFNLLTSFTGIVFFLLLLLPAWNLFLKKKEKTPVLQLSVVWVLLVAPVFGSDSTICRMFSSFLLAPLMAVFYPYAARSLQLDRLLRSLMIACLVAYGSGMIGRVYISGLYSRFSMDKFPMQEGIWADDLEYSRWEAIQDISVSVRATGARLNYDGWERYAYAYSMQVPPVRNLHLYHIKDDKSGIMRRRNIVDMYDAWLILGVDRHQITEICKMLREEGFEIVIDGVFKGHENVLLFMRPPYAECYRRNQSGRSAID